MDSYSKILIYYFSGTGNSRNVSTWISKFATNKNIPCELFDISKIERRNLPVPPENTLIVFCSPVHGFNYPPIMLHFIRHFPKGNNHVILMNTRAGMLIGKFITPGLTGVAFYLASMFLLIKGYSIRALYPVDLPSNWISLHPGLNDRTVKFLYEKNQLKVNAFLAETLAGKRSFRKASMELVQDIAIAPVALLYYFIGRFYISKTFYASHKCNNCGLCIKACPVKAIVKIDKRPFWTFHCESCMKCIGNCPEKAIEVGHGFIIAFTVFYSTVILVLFYKYFNQFFFKLDNYWLQFVIEPLLLIVFLSFAYRIFHWLLRFKFFEKIILYSSLTHYKFWGNRYKAPKEIMK
jgi:ferredoxin